MTLREQIRAIHAKYFSSEFHEFRGDLIPQMVNDLKIFFFDTLCDVSYIGDALVMDDTQKTEIRAIRLAGDLIAKTALRDNIPSVE